MGNRPNSIPASLATLSHQKVASSSQLHNSCTHPHPHRSKNMWSAANHLKHPGGPERADPGSVRPGVGRPPRRKFGLSTTIPLPDAGA